MEFIRLQTLHCLMIIHRCADDPEHSDQNLLDSYSWMQELNRTLEMMDPTSRFLMQNLFRNEKTDWYKPYWSKTTYYPLKKKAVQEFLNCFMPAF